MNNEFDIKNLSYQDLVELKRKIDEEVKDRSFYKGNVYCNKLSSLFAARWDDIGINARRWENLGKLYSSIYRICDFTLENFKLINPCGHKDEKQIKVNGSRIETGRPDLYSMMANEIFSVILKYFKELHSDKYDDRADKILKELEKIQDLYKED